MDLASASGPGACRGALYLLFVGRNCGLRKEYLFGSLSFGLVTWILERAEAL